MIEGKHTSEAVIVGLGCNICRSTIPSRGQECRIEQELSKEATRLLCGCCCCCCFTCFCCSTGQTLQASRTRSARDRSEQNACDRTRREACLERVQSYPLVAIALPRQSELQVRHTLHVADAETSPCQRASLTRLGGVVLLLPRRINSCSLLYTCPLFRTFRCD